MFRLKAAIAGLRVKKLDAAHQDGYGNCLLPPPPRALKLSRGESNWQQLQWQQRRLPPPKEPSTPPVPSASVSGTKASLRFPLLWSPGLRGSLDLSTGHSAYPGSRQLLPRSTPSSRLSHLYRAPGCHFRPPSMLSLIDISQIWTLPLESTLSRQGKSCCFCP